MPAKILSFNGEYRFLSNFWPCSVEYDGYVFPSVEHAFVYAKTEVSEEKDLIINEGLSLTPAQIKKLGRSLTLRPNWNEKRLEIMKELVTQKFTKNEELRNKLIATGLAELIEGNTWGDKFWGICDGEGTNHLGKILMEVRDYLQYKEDLKSKSSDDLLSIAIFGTPGLL